MNRFTSNRYWVKVSGRVAIGSLVKAGTTLQNKSSLIGYAYAVRRDRAKPTNSLGVVENIQTVFTDTVALVQWLHYLPTGTLYTYCENKL